MLFDELSWGKQSVPHVKVSDEESEVYWKDFRWKIIIFSQCDINEKKILVWHRLIDDLYDLFRVIGATVGWMWKNIDTESNFIDASSENTFRNFNKSLLSCFS